MQSLRRQTPVTNSSLSVFNPPTFRVTDSTNRAKRLKISEFISWSICFAVVSALTGLIKFLKVGVTMDMVTSILFYSSLAGLIYFVSKIIVQTKNPAKVNFSTAQELN
jgi:hypothetical protein